jgi:hypothetical protein
MNRSRSSRTTTIKTVEQGTLPAITALSFGDGVPTTIHMDFPSLSFSLPAEARWFGFDNCCVPQTENQFVTARGGVANEESIFVRSLQLTRNNNSLQVLYEGEVTRKIDIGGTAANAWHSNQGDFLSCVFPMRKCLSLGNSR